MSESKNSFGSRTAVASVAMIAASCLWAFSGFFSRNLSELGFNTSEMTLLRSLFTSAILFIIILIFDKDSLKLKPKHLWIFLLFAAAKYLFDVFFAESQIRIEMSVSTVLQFTSPYWILLFSAIFLGEIITKRKIVAVCIGFIGCILVTGAITNFDSLDTAGVVFGLASGLTFGLYTFGNKVLLNLGYSPTNVMFYTFLLSVLFALPFSDIAQIPEKMSNPDAVWNLLGAGILLTLIPYYLQVYATKVLSPVTVILIGLLEVAASALVGFMIYGETLDVLNIIGLVLIPVSIAVMTVNPKDSKNNQNENIDGGPGRI